MVSTRILLCGIAKLLKYVLGVQEWYIENALNKTRRLAVGFHICFQYGKEGAVEILFGAGNVAGGRWFFRAEQNVTHRLERLIEVAGGFMDLTIRVEINPCRADELRILVDFEVDGKR